MLKTKRGSGFSAFLTHGSRKSESTYIFDPQNSLHEIIIYTSQIKQGKIDLSGYFEGCWKRLAYFTESGISGWVAHIKSCCDVNR